MTLPVTLFDLYSGKEFDVDVSKQVIAEKASDRACAGTIENPLTSGHRE
jgi:hypothetical protein